MVYRTGQYLAGRLLGNAAPYVYAGYKMTQKIRNNPAINDRAQNGLRPRTRPPKFFRKPAVKAKASNKILFVKPSAEGITQSKVTFQGNPSKSTSQLEKMYKAVSNKSTLDTLATMGCTVISGRTSTQAIATVTSTFGTTDINNIYQVATQGVTSGSTLISNGAATASTKLLLQDCTQKTVFYNQSNTSAEVEIYDLVYKNDGSATDPITAWTSGLIAQNFNYAAAYQGGNSSVMPYAKPTVSRLFNQTFKIIKHTKLELGPGSGHCHQVKYSPHKVLDTFDLEYLTAKKNLSATQLMIARGVWTDTNSTGTIGSIAMTPPKIVGVVHKSFNSRLVSNNFRTYNDIIAIPNLGAVPLFVENDQTGSVVVAGTSGSYA